MRRFIGGVLKATQFLTEVIVAVLLPAGSAMAGAGEDCGGLCHVRAFYLSTPLRTQGPH